MASHLETNVAYILWNNETVLKLAPNLDVDIASIRKSDAHVKPLASRLENNAAFILENNTPAHQIKPRFNTFERLTFKRYVTLTFCYYLKT